jgi:peptide deformylase
MGEILDIIINPDKRLRLKAKKVDEKDIKSQKMQKLCLDMFETMMVKDGIGLAAPQIGESIRLVTINTKNKKLFMFNPEIIKKSLLKETDEEGCLSLPMYFGEVKRHKSITCCFVNENGEKQTLKASGLLARVIQHETDHLDGVLFIDKAKNIKKIDEIKDDDEE